MSVAHWVLVLVFSANAHVTALKVEPFTSRDACELAGKTVAAGWKNWSLDTYAVCVEVR